MDNSIKPVNDRISSVSRAIYALTSSVLTTVICDTLSNTQYQAQYNGSPLVFSEVSNNSASQISLVILVFCLTWGISTYLIPYIQKLYQRFRYHNLKPSTAKKMTLLLEQAIKTINYLEPYYNNSTVDNRYKASMQQLYSKQLFQTIIQLNNTFCPANKLIAINNRDKFRRIGTTTLCDVRRKLSDYELYSVVNVLSLMVDQLQYNANGNPLLNADCIKSKEYLEEILIFCDSINQQNT